MPSISSLKPPRTLRTLFFIFLILSLLLVFFLSNQAEQRNKKALDIELSLSLANVGKNIDLRIAQMKLIAKSIANDAHINAWVDAGFNVEGETVLLDKLGFYVAEYGLTSASFADKDSHKYWNHEGFLRVLNPDIDTWYFAYLASGDQDLVSVYHDKNKQRVDLYVNYQQTNGNGLSGIATPFNGVLANIQASMFGQQGDIFLVDNAGKVQVHSNSDIAGTQTLQTMYGKEIAAQLLKLNSTQFLDENTLEYTLLGSSYIPSMNWFLVTEVKKDNVLQTPLTLLKQTWIALLIGFIAICVVIVFSLGKRKTL